MRCKVHESGEKRLSMKMALALVAMLALTTSSSAVPLPWERPLASEPRIQSAPAKKVGAWAQTRLCSSRLRQHMKGEHLSWHDQAQFLRDCRNERREDLFDASEPPSSINKWTKRQWDAAKIKWRQDQARFYGCNDKWKAQSPKKMSLHDQNTFLFSCMNEKP